MMAFMKKLEVVKKNVAKEKKVYDNYKKKFAILKKKQEEEKK